MRFVQNGLTMLAAAAMAVSLAGCVGDNESGSGDVQGSERISTSSGGSEQVDRQDQSDANDRPADRQIPAGAKLMGHWAAERLNFKAPSDGNVYVYDRRQKRVVYAAELHRGDNFSLNRRQSQAFINDQVVLSLEKEQGHDYQVYFDGGQ